MATFTATTTADSGAGSLRQAVLDANASAGADTIVFDAAFDGGAEDIIRLTSGQIDITDELAIVGGPSRVTVTGDAAGDDVTIAGGITDVDASLGGSDRLDDNSRIFDATNALTLSGLVLTGGRTTADFSHGGAVRGSTITVTNSTVSGNSTAGNNSLGGGIFGYGVTLTNSTISGNSTAGDSSYGGGIFGGNEVTLTNSTVSGNSTTGDSSDGGGVSGYSVTLTNSTASGNSTAGDNSYGGGIFGFEVTLANSTVSGNNTTGDSSYGGGIHGFYDVTLTNSIVLGNVTIAAGVDGDEIEGSNTLAGGNILGGNVFDGETDVGDVTAEMVFADTSEIAPGVFAGLLADNGGPTRTILIAAGGPAVDAGGATVVPVDQRGLERVVGAAVDLGAVELGAGPAEPGSLVVTTALDVVANDGLTSLREAVFFANLEPGADTITFEASVFDGEAPDVIRLTRGQISITDALAIEGGAAGVTITGDANGDDVTGTAGITDVAASGAARLADNSRIFDATAALTLDGLTLTGGRTTAESADGGAVQGTTVTLRNSTISGNSTAGNSSGGGGIAGFEVTLTNSTVSGNSTAGDNSQGGGIFGFEVTLTNSTVSGNSTTGDSSEGGGISGDDLTVTNSTINGNSTAGYSSRGGGISGYDLTVTNSTISGNSTAGAYSYGGGFFTHSGPDNEVVTTNSIILGNATIYTGLDGDEVDGTAVTRAGGNILGPDIFDGDTDVGDVTAAEVFAATSEIAPGVLAGLLADNGGPTRTILINAGGPAVDAGGPTPLVIDQRGLERVSGAAVDLGSIELGADPIEPGSLVVTTALDVVANDGLTSLREAVFFADHEPGADTITFDASVFDGEASDVIRLTRGQINISEALTIEGGAAGVTLTGDANGNDVTSADGITDVAASGAARLADNSRIFNATAALTLDGLTLTGGRTTAESAGGGAVSGASVALMNSTISGNSTSGEWFANGGGISGDDVTVTNSTISGNSTSGFYSYGGGVFGDRVTLTNSTVSGNGTSGDLAYGGGIFAESRFVTTDSVVLGNAAISTGVGDEEVYGAAVTRAGGNILGQDIFDGDADVGDVTAAEVFAATTEIAPGVFAGALADNGGPTWTIAIRGDGPAAGAADPATATTTDQRGYLRDGAPDLGAFEAGAGPGGLTLVGGPGRDVLVGGAFADDISGLGGNDRLCGRAGDDVIRGNKGCDVLRGGAGDDVLAGGKGQDVLEGGAGFDELRGDRGADWFTFAAGFGTDVIVGFDANPTDGQDRINLRPLGVTAADFTEMVEIQAVAGGVRVVVAGQGSILLPGVYGAGANALTQADFLLA